MLLGMAAGTAAATMGVRLKGYAQTAHPASSPALQPGVFTVAVDDIRIYAEVRGTGPLMILQNGMWLDSFTFHFGGAFMAALAKYFTVLTFDPRGQGRTSAGSGAITYGRFAADTARLMDAPSGWTAMRRRLMRTRHARRIRESERAEAVAAWDHASRTYRQIPSVQPRPQRQRSLPYRTRA